LAKGIDIQIERLRSYLAAKLFTTNNCDWFGRVFRNVKNGEIMPERYLSGVDYLSVLLNDNKDLTCFFDVQPTESYDNGFSSEVWILFSVNLQRLYPTVTTERATEYIHDDIIQKVKRIGGWKVTGLVRGLTSFSDYPNARPEHDKHPYYLFRLNCEIKYPLNC
jgi:hypothetical protein